MAREAEKLAERMRLERGDTVVLWGPGGGSERWQFCEADGPFMYVTAQDGPPDLVAFNTLQLMRVEKQNK